MKSIIVILALIFSLTPKSVAQATSRGELKSQALIEYSQIPEYEQVFDMSHYDEVYGPGEYAVGEDKDMPAGEYRLVAIPEERTHSFTITNDEAGKDLIEHNFVETFSYIQVDEGQFIELTNINAIPITDVQPIGMVDDSFIEGDYRVGTDINAGEYKIFAEEDSASVMLSEDLMFSDNTYRKSYQGSILIEIQDGQVLRVHDGYGQRLGDIPTIDMDEPIGPGMYRVGIDIEPGKYSTHPYDESGSYRLYGDIMMGENIAGGVFYEDYYIEAYEGEYLTVSDGEIELVSTDRRDELD